MCKAPKPPKSKEPKKPQFLRNVYLDEFVGDAAAVKSLKSGRDTLRIPLGVPAVGGRQPGESLVPATTTPSGTDFNNGTQVSPFQPGPIGPRRKAGDQIR